MPSAQDILAAKIVLKNGLADVETVRRCIDLQNAEGDEGDVKDLIGVMVEEDVLSASRAKRVYRAVATYQFQRSEKVYARLAREMGYVEPDVIDRFLEKQRQEGFQVHLSQMLIDQDHITLDENEEIFNRQLQVLAEMATREEDEFHLTMNGVAGAAEDSVLNRVDPIEDSSGPGLARPDAQTTEAPAALPVDMEVEEEQPAAGSGFGEGSDPLVGRTIAERYRILSSVGEGGMGRVYLAEHVLMEKKVAFKVLHPDLITDDETLARFKREVKAAARFAHPNVIQIFDAGEASEAEGSIYYMAMEYIPGEDLGVVIDRDGCLPLRRVVHVLRQVLSAVDEAHKKGIVHRDLKADNIMLLKGRHGEDIAKVMDFGIAKVLEQASQEQAPDEPGPGGRGKLFKTQAGIVTGTPQYMSPEQASGGRIDHRSDLYSLGVIMFEMIAGRLPFQSETPMGFIGKHIVEPPPALGEVRPDLSVPGSIAAIVARCLEKDREARYQTAGEILEDLERAVRQDVPAALPSTDDGSASDASGRVPPAGVAGEVDSGSDRTAPGPVPGTGGGGGLDPTKVAVALGAGVTVTILVVALALALVLGGGDSEERVVAALERSDEVLREAESPAELERTAATLRGLLDAGLDDERLRERLRRVREAADELRTERMEELERAMETGERALADDRLNEAREHLEAALELLATVAPDDRERRDEIYEMLSRVDDRRNQQEVLDERRRLAEEGERLFDQDAFAEAADRFDRALELGSDPEGRLRTLRDEARHRALVREADVLLADARSRGPLDATVLREAIRTYERALRHEVDAEVARATRQKLEQRRAELEELEARVQRRTVYERELENAQALLADLELDAAAEAARAARHAARELGPAQVSTVENLQADIAETREASAALAEASALRDDLADRMDVAPEEYDRAIEAFQAFLADHPDGPLAERARSSIEELRAEKEAQLEAERARQEREEREREEALARSRETARELAAQGRVDDAIRILERALEAGWAEDEEVAELEEAVASLERRREIESVLPETLVWVPAGRFGVGGRERAEETVESDGFFIGRHEVTRGEYHRFCRDTRRDFPGRNFSPASARFPVARVSREDAEAYCAWLTDRLPGASARLPTEAEWEIAAGWDPETETLGRFPWGRGAPDATRVALGDVALVESKNRGRSPFGVYDALGNLWEWTATTEGGRAVSKGGSYLTSPGQLGVTMRTLSPPDIAVPDRGFRIVVEPDAP